MRIIADVVPGQRELVGHNNLLIHRLNGDGVAAAPAGRGHLAVPVETLIERGIRRWGDAPDRDVGDISVRHHAGTIGHSADLIRIGGLCGHGHVISLPGQQPAGERETTVTRRGFVHQVVAQHQAATQKSVDSAGDGVVGVGCRLLVIGDGERCGRRDAERDAGTVDRGEFHGLVTLDRLVPQYRQPDQPWGGVAIREGDGGVEWREIVAGPGCSAVTRTLALAAPTLPPTRVTRTRALSAPDSSAR